MTVKQSEQQCYSKEENAADVLLDEHNVAAFVFMLYWGGGNDTAVDVAQMEDRFYNVSFQVNIFMSVVDFNYF